MDGSTTTVLAPHYGEKGVPAEENYPGARTNSTSWTDLDGNFWLFGGSSRNDLWKYNPKIGQWAWMDGSTTISQRGIYGIKGVPDKANCPGARIGASGWVDNEGNLWLFGGRTESSPYFNDLWKYDIAMGMWTWVKGTNTYNSPAVYGERGIPAENNTPRATSFAASWKDQAGNFWLFSGNSYNDLWKFETKSGNWIWISGSLTFRAKAIYGQKSVPSKTNDPGARSYAASCTDSEGDLLLFGGVLHGAGNSYSSGNDLWKFDISSESWIWLSGDTIVNQPGIYLTKGAANPLALPGSRYFSNAWLDSSGNFWLFGGVSFGSDGLIRFVSDVWKYDSGAALWTWVTGSDGADELPHHGNLGEATVLTTPGARSHLVSWTDSSGDQWLYGGFGSPGFSRYGDLWKYDMPRLALTKSDDSGGTTTRDSLLRYSLRYANVDDPAEAGEAITGLHLIDSLPEHVTYVNAVTSSGILANVTESSGVVTIDVDELSAGDYGEVVISVRTDDGYTGPIENTVVGSYPAGQDSEFVSSVTATRRTIVNNPPVAIDDRYRTPENVELVVSGTSGVTANDINNDNDRLTIDVVLPPQHGTLAIEENGGFSYIPTVGYYGNDSFSYTISDGYETSHIANVQLTIDHAFAGTWTWMKGSNTTNTTGTYGEFGVPAATNNPGARERALRWTDSLGNFWLYGGAGLHEQAYGDLSDLWKFDLQSWQWTWVAGSSGEGPFANWGVRGVAHPDNTPGRRKDAVTWTGTDGTLWFFGGEAGVHYNDLWKFDPITELWTWVSGSKLYNQPGIYGTKGVAHPDNCPGTRIDALGWTDADGNLWLFGGRGRDSRTGPGYETTFWLNDLWKFNIETKEWTWMGGSNLSRQYGVYATAGTAHEANQPGARYGSATWTDRTGKFWLYGGSGYGSAGLGLLSDLWTYDPGTDLWTWVSGSDTHWEETEYGTKSQPSPLNTPGARVDSASWVDMNGRFWLFGGNRMREVFHGYENDLWVYDIASGQWTWGEGSPAPGQYGVYGNQGVSTELTGPGGRYETVSWTDVSGDLWLFGGRGHGTTGIPSLLNDLWRYQITPPTSHVADWALY